MAPIDGAASGGLCILPNLEMNRINFPHETETDGTLILTKTVNTAVRVGYSGSPPTASMQVTMSMHDGSGEITANRVTTGKPMYTGSSNSLTQKMKTEVPPQPDLDPAGSGVARGACVAEATFMFKFSVTASQVRGNSTNTPVWLRFTVEGAPNLYVETAPFRLVARKDERETVATLMMSALKSTKQASAALDKAIAKPPTNHPGDAQILIDARTLMDQARAKLQQHSAAPQPSTNGGGAPVTVGAAVAAPQPIANGGGALVAVSDGHDDPRWEDNALISQLVAEIRETPDGAALLGQLTDDGDIVPPPPTRQRTEEPPLDVRSLFGSRPCRRPGRRLCWWVPRPG